MPLRDHFNPPWLRQSWESIHFQFAGKIAASLNRVLPEEYAAGPLIRSNISKGLPANFEEPFVLDFPSPVLPTFSISSNWSSVDDYQVHIHDRDNYRDLVATIEIVGDSNKDTPVHRRLFVAKCLTLLQRGISVTIVDFVTNRRANLYGE